VDRTITILSPRRRACIRFALLSVVLLSFPTALDAQASASIQGTVVSLTDGSPLQGVTVFIPGTAFGTLTDARGRFQIVGLPAGRHEVLAQRLGLAPSTQVVDLAAGASQTVSFRLGEQALLVPEVIVSATGETQRLSQTAASVGVISGDELQANRPTHPAAVMSQIPGVWVNVTGGEGHMTSIRQPQTTKPVYLYLEDGVPTRSTGFFNHNALYEVNLPQADRVEVLKGPASALYGSDAIGGVINVETRRPSIAPSIDSYVEGGRFGYSRFLGSASNTWGGNGLRADLNLTRTDGWRDATAYDRQSGTLRWDSYFSDRITVRTVLTGSRIDQQTAGSSALPRDTYETDPTRNIAPISLRNVRAARFSSTAEIRGERTLFSVTPFARWNEMDLLPNWTLAFDPTISTTGHSSLGLLARARRDFDFLSTRLIGGVDLDRSPGARQEHRVDATRIDGVFADYTRGDLIYDYDVTFESISPYVQAEASLTDALHLSAGLRFDRMSYDYDTRLEPLATGRWRRPADVKLTYQSLSPKVGLAYDFGPAIHLFGNYTRGFRAPSEGQIFRQGQAANTVELDPVHANSVEAGLRGELLGRLGYSLSAYSMNVRNDILNFTNPDGTTETQNAGETLHRGVEVGVNVAILDGLRADVGYSRAKHSYERWNPRETVSYSGKEMEMAPNTILNGRLAFSPAALSGSRFGVEWNRIGGYWLNPENTHRYEGHHLFNLSANVPLFEQFEMVGRLLNVFDERYAESAAFTQARGEELAPGMPRTFYLGLQYRWGR
jgi:iron complex outermembrane recepter protein